MTTKKLKSIRFKKSVQKVALAKDVLKQLDHLKIETGEYINNKYFEASNLLERFLLDKEILSKCNLCAKGALFISYVKTKEKDLLPETIKLEEENECIIDGDKLTDILTNIFEIDEINIIEDIFENNEEDSYENFQLDSAAEEIIKIWNETYFSPKDLLRAIMNNIVRNGYFNPLEVKKGKLIAI